VVGRIREKVGFKPGMKQCVMNDDRLPATASLPPTATNHVSCMDVSGTIRYAIFTCARKMTASQLNLPHGTKKAEKISRGTKNKEN